MTRNYDKELIQSQIEDVIKYSQEYDININCKSFVDEWEAAKNSFIHSFGGQPIYTVPEEVTFSLSFKEQKAKFSDFIEDIAEQYDNVELINFLQEIPLSDFYNNLLTSNYNNGEISVPAGTKIVKDFKYFEKNKDILTDVQNEASRIIQENKITGTLCFSVHPLDYLSISENDHNWRSCHALDGDYRAGNLSYMLDSSTVVCYLRSKEDTQLLSFPNSIKWNSKKWRVLLFMSQNGDMMFAGRQYPFMTDNALDIIQRYFPSDWGEWSEWSSHLINKNPQGESLEFPYIGVGHHLISTRKLIIEPKNPLFFNDLLYSSVYTPRYSYQKLGTTRYSSSTGLTSSNTRFKIGAPVICPCCNRDEIADHSSMLCDACTRKTHFYWCECCGDRIVGEENTYSTYDVDILCYDCYKNKTVICPSCGKRVYRTCVHKNDNDEDVCFYCDELPVEKQLELTLPWD